MRCLVMLTAVSWLFHAAVWAQPVVGGVVNSASYSKAPLDANSTPIGNNLVAQGAIFVVFGTGMGPAALVTAQDLPLPNTLPPSQPNGTSVTISSGAQTPILYTSAVQVAAILPSTTPLGKATVTVTYNGKTSAPFPITVVKSALGIFTRNSQGNGPPIAQIPRSPTDAPLDSLTNPAKSGDTVVIYGTGLGAIPGPDNAKPGAVPVGSNVTVNIAGISVPADYAGRSPDFPGLDQINFVVPANVPAGCYIPAEITASGISSNLFYLSLGPGPACNDPLGLSPAALAKLDSGGTVSIGLFHLLRANQVLPIQGAGGLFDQVNADGAFQLFNRIPNAFGGINFPVASGSCAVLDTLDTSNTPLIPDFSAIGGKELKAAATLQVTPPNGSPQDLVPFLTGGYLGVFSVTQGTWTVAGPAGPDIGAFTAKTDLPPDLVWANAGNFSTAPRTDLTITWTGGDLNSNSLVTILGSNVVINPADPSKSRGKTFFCNAPASTGKFVIPAAVVSQLPSSNVDASAGEKAVGTLGISTGGGSPFSAPLSAGGSIDAGLLSYGEASSISVKYQ